MRLGLFLILFLSETLFANQETELYSILDDKGSYLNRTELRLIGSQDFIDPYADHYSVGAGVVWQVSKFSGVGVEFSKFGASENDVFVSKLKELENYGIKVLQVRRDFQARILYKMTFIRGHLNLFSNAVLPMEISLNSYLGAMRLIGHDLSLNLGMALEANLGFGSDWGIFLMGFWDHDEGPERLWFARFGFSLGPRIRI